MPRGTPAGFERSVGARGRISIKDTVVANSSERFAAHLGQVVTNGDRVIAGIEDKQRDFFLTAEESDETADLLDGRCRGVEERCDAHHVEGGGPRIVGPAQLADPLIVPARHDGLSGRVFGGRVVVAPLGAALGVAPVPGRRVDGEDKGPRRRSVLDEQAAESLLVNAATLERLVEAAVRAAEHRLEAKGGHRGDRKRRAQHGIGQFEEGVAPAPQGGMELGPKVPELAPGSLLTTASRHT